jgi:hypothetical protein
MEKFKGFEPPANPDTNKNPEAQWKFLEKINKNQDSEIESNSQNSKAARDISNKLFLEVQELKGKWDKTLDSNVDSDMQKFTQLMNSPDIRDSKTGNISSDGMRQIKELYNSIHGSIHWVKWSGTEKNQKSTQEENDKKDAKNDSFAEQLRTWREWQERESQQKAAGARKEWDRSTWSTNPNLAKKTNAESAERFQIEFP